MAVRRLNSVPAHASANGLLSADIYDLGRGPETAAQRVRRLQEEARMLAREQVEIFTRDFNALAARAQEIAEGGEPYPAGVREMASRIPADLPQKAQALMSIMDRTTPL